MLNQSIDGVEVWKPLTEGRSRGDACLWLIKLIWDHMLETKFP